MNPKPIIIYESIFKPILLYVALVWEDPPKPNGRSEIITGDPKQELSV